MSAHGIEILRLVLAGLNGLIFALGIWYVLDLLVLRVRRWKQIIIRLELLLDRQPDHPSADNIQRQIDNFRERVLAHQRDPRTPLRVGLGVLAIALAVVALVGLVAPPWTPFLP